jgi:chromosome partitioning protein
MFRAVFANQKGGVGKTTSTLTIGRCFADLGYKVLLVDTDNQGNIATILGLKTSGKNLFSFLVKGYALKDCVIEAVPNLDVLCGDRETEKAEAVINVDSGKQYAFVSCFPKPESSIYDVILFDAAPTITLLGTCAAVYTQRVIVPVSMDSLAIQGAVGSISAYEQINRDSNAVLNIQIAGILPVMVDRRLQITQSILDSIKDLSARKGIPVLPAVRTDAIVTRAWKKHEFLQEFEPASKALLDYKASSEALAELYKGQFDGRKFEQTA